MIVKKLKINSFILPTLNFQGIQQRRQRLQIIKTREIPYYGLLETEIDTTTSLKSKSGELVTLSPLIVENSPSPIIVFLCLQLAFLFGLISWILKKICELIDYFLVRLEKKQPTIDANKFTNIKVTKTYL